MGNSHVYSVEPRSEMDEPRSEMDEPRSEMDELTMDRPRSSTLEQQVQELTIPQQVLTVINDGSAESLQSIQNECVREVGGIRYRCQHKYTIGEIRAHLVPKNRRWGTTNFIELTGIPINDEIVPKGRYGQTITRDDQFTRNMLLHLDSLGDLNNILFLNYTGHLSSFASALLSRQIDCVWQIPAGAISHMNPLTQSIEINDRLIEQLQDTVTSTLTPFTATINSFGIVLEAPHSLGATTIDIRRLPIRPILDRLRITRVVVFDESTYPFRTTDLESHRFHMESFKTYLLSLRLEVIILGADYR